MVAKGNLFYLCHIATGLLLIYLILLQFVLTPDVQAPWILFWIFAGVTAGLMVLLQSSTRWGAWGITIWGLLSATGALRVHQGAITDWLLITLSLSLSGAGVLFLARGRRGSAGIEQE